MTISTEITEKLSLLFGEQWWEKDCAERDMPGHVAVWLRRKTNGSFSIAQHWDWKGVPLPAPEFFFRLEEPIQSVQLISWEDWLDDERSGLHHQFNSIEGKEGREKAKLQEELSLKLLDYLKTWEDYSGRVQT